MTSKIMATDRKRATLPAIILWKETCSKSCSGMGGDAAVGEGATALLRVIFSFTLNMVGKGKRPSLDGELTVEEIGW